MRMVALAAAAIAALSIGGPALATQTFDYSFTASGMAGPAPTVTGTFQLSYDPTETVFPYALVDLDVQIADALYTEHNSWLTVFGTPPASGNLTGLANDGDFSLSWTFGSGPGEINLTAFSYDSFPNNTFPQTGEASAQLGTLTIDTGVPEPAAWAMMLVGFGAIGAAARRRRCIPATV